MSKLARRATRAGQLITHTVSNLLSREIRLRDFSTMVAWKRVRATLPPVRCVEDDRADRTRLFEVGGVRTWWPDEYPPEGLDVTWAEVFCPFPPNGHAYEFGSCQLAPGMWVVDAGSCEGFFVHYALRKGCSVIAVEPLPRLSYCLRKTFRAEEEAGRVHIVNALLGADIGLGRIDIPHTAFGARSGGDVGEPVPVTTLDALMQSERWPGFEFVKMDIEGAEMDAVQGAQRSIARLHPTFSIAVYHDFRNPELVRRLLLAPGRPYHIELKGLLRRGPRWVRQILHASPENGQRPRSPA